MASSFQPGGVLMDLGPNGRSGSFAGAVATAFDPAGSFGVVSPCASGGIWYASGSPAANVTFGPAPGIPATFSYCLVGRFTGPATARVVTSDGGTNWVLGHSGGQAGAHSPAAAA